MKDKTTAIILSALLGGLGVGGCFGILWILDIVNIASGKLQPADGSGYSDTSNAAAPKATAIDPYDELKKIAQLKEQGIINEEEYAKMKADCLAKL